MKYIEIDPEEWTVGTGGPKMFGDDTWTGCLLVQAARQLGHANPHHRYGQKSASTFYPGLRNGANQLLGVLGHNDTSLTASEAVKAANGYLEKTDAKARFCIKSEVPDTMPEHLPYKEPKPLRRRVMTAMCVVLAVVLL